jgi:hypothetical protein
MRPARYTSNNSESATCICWMARMLRTLGHTSGRFEGNAEFCKNDVIFGLPGKT